MIFCRGCGKEIHETASSCPFCGALQTGVIQEKKKQVRSQTTAFLWTIFLGNLGVHRFYLGQIGFGLLYLFTLGLFGIGSLIDAFRLAFMSPQDFADKYNQGILGSPVGSWAKVLVLAPLVLIVAGLMLLVGGEAHKSYEGKKSVAELMPESSATPSPEKSAPSSKPALEIYQAQAGGMNYRKAMFEEYRHGELVELVGVVDQIIDSDHIAVLTKRDELLGYTDDRVMVSVKGAKVLEKDMVKIYARYDGTFEYETVLHVNTKIPKVRADYLDIIGQQG